MPKKREQECKCQPLTMRELLWEQQQQQNQEEENDNNGSRKSNKVAWKKKNWMVSEEKMETRCWVDGLLEWWSMRTLPQSSSYHHSGHQIWLVSESLCEFSWDRKTGWYLCKNLEKETFDRRKGKKNTHTHTHTVTPSAHTKKRRKMRPNSFGDGLIGLI